MSKYTVLGNRWIWDLYPLDRNAWAARSEQDDGRRAGTVLTFISAPIGPGPHNHGSRQLYMPTDEDLSIIEKLYPNEDPTHPQFHRIEADLVAGGFDANIVRTSPVTVLLVFLRQLLEKRNIYKPIVATPKLTERQRIILKILSKLRPGRGLEGKEIQSKLPKPYRKSESTLRRHDFPELIKAGLIVNTPGIGYCLPTAVVRRTSAPNRA